MFDAFPDPFDDFACAFDCAFTDVFGAFAGSGAGGGGAIDGVKGDDVTRALRHASSDIACASRGSLPDVARATADLAARAAGFLFFFMVLAGLIGLIRIA